MALIREKSGEAFYATVTSGETRFYLIVGSDGTRWDWTVWRPGEEKEARYGHAATLEGNAGR